MKTLLALLVTIVGLAAKDYVNPHKAVVAPYSDCVSFEDVADYDATLSVPQFDPALGFLLRVQFEIAALWRSTLLEPQPPITLFGVAYFHQDFLESVVGGGGSMPLFIASPISGSSITTTGDSTDPYGSDFDVSAFVGSGNVEVQVIGSNRIRDTAIVPPSYISTEASACFTVTYTYVPYKKPKGR